MEQKEYLEYFSRLQSNVFFVQNEHKEMKVELTNEM